MAKPAGKLLNATGVAFYEQPLSERMRTLMRLEFLYQQLLYNSDDASDWASRASISTLLDVLAILSRGDLRSEIHKELEHQLTILQRFQSQPGVDDGRLDSLVNNLMQSRKQITAIGTGFLQAMKDSEFLNAIKHRSAIPGGTCEFDLPEYSHWLRQPIERRQDDISHWFNDIRPLCDAAVELLWLVRESKHPEDQLASNGMYQHSMQKDASCRLIRVSLPAEQNVYPEISGSQHRFTVRFLEWQSVSQRATQVHADVPFQLAIC